MNAYEIKHIYNNAIEPLLEAECSRILDYFKSQAQGAEPYGVVIVSKSSTAYHGDDVCYIVKARKPKSFAQHIRQYMIEKHQIELHTIKLSKTKAVMRYSWYE
jgi:hypothetical protein